MRTVGVRLARSARDFPAAPTAHARPAGPLMLALPKSLRLHAHCTASACAPTRLPHASDCKTCTARRAACLRICTHRAHGMPSSCFYNLRFSSELYHQAL